MGFGLIKREGLSLKFSFVRHVFTKLFSNLKVGFKRENIKEFLDAGSWPYLIRITSSTQKNNLDLFQVRFVEFIEDNCKLLVVK